MNPIEEGGNQFAQLFEKMPAKRIGKSEDIAGAILYLCSQAGVSQPFDCCPLLRMNKR
jgi:NAD(P)-dependent dehydrogenase (short-subunit alcohol dehydrogenase family)